MTLPGTTELSMQLDFHLMGRFWPQLMMVSVVAFVISSNLV